MERISVPGQALANSDPPTTNFEGMAVNPSKGVALNLLLDVRGYHCYNYAVILYVRNPSDPFSGGQNPHTGLTGHRIYPLPWAPQFFLTKKIEVGPNQPEYPK